MKSNKTRHKQDLPQKICPVCQRPFSWRRKWASQWEEIRYCSERCRRERNTRPDNSQASQEKS